MPAQYEAMRDEFIRQGLDEMAAKTKAAKIYNAHRGNKPPVTRNTPKHEGMQRGK